MMLCSLDHPWRVCRDPHPRTGHLFPACPLKGDAWDILVEPKRTLVSLWLSSSPAQICLTFCDVYCCCMESTWDVGLALNPIDPVICFGRVCSPIFVTPRFFLRDVAATGNTWGISCLFLATAGAPSSTCPATCIAGGPGSVHNYPPGIAYVLRVVLHCDGQPVLCHLLPVQWAVYVDNATLPRKKGGNRYKGQEECFPRTPLAEARVLESIHGCPGKARL